MNELDLTIGAHVFCADGKCGKLAKFAVNPDTWQVTHLIIEEGLVLKRARVLPFFAVRWATPYEIHLFIDADDLPNYPELREDVIERYAPEEVEGSLPALTVEQEGVPYAHSVVRPVPTVRETVRRGIPESLEVVERGTPINGPDGSIGKLEHFLVNGANGEITYLIILRGVLFTTKWVVPVSMAETLSERGISIAVTAEALKGLRQYEPQSEKVYADDDGEENGGTGRHDGGHIG